MLFFSIFLSGFTLGVFAALKIFAPEYKQESWDPQNFPAKYSSKTQKLIGHIKKPVFIDHFRVKHSSHIATIK
jgi:hypothetical protein